MMGSGMATPVLGVIALVASTALLVWVAGHTQNPAKKAGTFLAWVAVVVSLLIILGQVLMCAKMCSSGMCGRGMGPGGGMGMGKMILPTPPPMEESK